MKTTMFSCGGIGVAENGARRSRDLTDGERNLVGRSELAAEDWALSEEEERNGQRERERRKRGEVFGKNEN